jgi:hypothetical protein
VRRVDVDATWVELEPGDGTHYEFLVAPVPQDAPSAGLALFVASVSRGSGCPEFLGYAYSVEDLRAFAVRFPRSTRAGPEDYRQAAIAEDPLADGFVGYVLSKSGTRAAPCNPWTALAAIRAALEVIGHAY